MSLLGLFYQQLVSLVGLKLAPVMIVRVVIIG
jgi:hypothetical protein